MVCRQNVFRFSLVRLLNNANQKRKIEQIVTSSDFEKKLYREVKYTSIHFHKIELLDLTNNTE